MAGNSRLFKRLVMPYFILITIIISITTVITYFASVSILRNEAVKSQRKVAERTAQLTDTFVEELIALADQVNHQQKITGLFYRVQDENDKSKNYFDTDILSSIDISSSLKSLLAGRKGQYNIVIYNNLGDWVSSQNYLINREKPAEFTRAEQYNKTVEEVHSNGGFVIKSPAENPWTNSGIVYITFQKELKNEYSEESCGIIEIRASVTQLEELLADGENTGGQVLIRNLSNGEIIYPYGYDEEENVSYITAPLKKIGWDAAIPYNDGDIKDFSTQLILLFVILYIVLMAVVLVVALAIGRYVSKPILQLAEHVRKIDTPEGKLVPIEKSIDEIKELEESFNTMLRHMNNSLQREKKAYSLALQAQMNPHFLYNSLAVIGAAGTEAGADNVYDMCTKLSDMLRYVAAYEKVTVQLKEEISHTRNYLSLMKSRYEELFTYSIEVDDKLMGIPVPKLFIQPLAENCFKHGFKETQPPWNIKITMQGSRDKWELVIRDNGSGITQERIEEINKEINNALSDMVVGNIGGLGIANTIIRLKMTHNSRINYSISNDNGMVIRIVSGD